MTEFIVWNLEKWMHQNRAQYTGAYVDGCLLDNFVLSVKRGYAFIYETYLNANSSAYRCKFVPYKNQDMIDSAWAEWYNFAEKVEAEI